MLSSKQNGKVRSMQTSFHKFYLCELAILRLQSTYVHLNPTHSAASTRRSPFIPKNPAKSTHSRQRRSAGLEEFLAEICPTRHKERRGQLYNDALSPETGLHRSIRLSHLEKTQRPIRTPRRRRESVFGPEDVVVRRGTPQEYWNTMFLGYSTGVPPTHLGTGWPGFVGASTAFQGRVERPQRDKSPHASTHFHCTGTCRSLDVSVLGVGPILPRVGLLSVVRSCYTIQ